MEKPASDVYAIAILPTIMESEWLQSNEHVLVGHRISGAQQFSWKSHDIKQKAYSSLKYSLSLSKTWWN